MPLLKITFVFNFLFVSLFIIPFISLLISFLSFYYAKPQIQRFELTPTIFNQEIVFNYKVEAKTQSTIYVNVCVPESAENFSSFSTHMSVNNKDVYITMKYRSPVFMLLDTILFFPLIKLNIYNQEQQIKQEAVKIEAGVHDIKIVLHDKLRFKSFKIDVVEGCCKIKTFIYENELFYKCVVYVATFFMFFFIVLYFTVVLYRKLCLTVNGEVDEIIKTDSK